MIRIDGRLSRDFPAVMIAALLLTPVITHAQKPAKESTVEVKGVWVAGARVKATRANR